MIYVTVQTKPQQPDFYATVEIDGERFNGYGECKWTAILDAIQRAKNHYNRPRETVESLSPDLQPLLPF